MDLPFSIDLIVHAFNLEKDQAAWDMWISLYPLMNIQMVKPQKFTEFKDALTKFNVRYSQKTDQEVIDEMLALVAQYEGR